MGKNRSVSRIGPALRGWGNWSRGPIPTSGHLSESEEKHLRLRVKQLVCGSVNEWESDSPCHNYTSPRLCSSWELEFKDCGAIPRQGLLLTAEWQMEGMWRRRLCWEMPMEESQAAMEARRYCWVTCKGWSHHHSLSPQASIGSWTVERLAHQTPDALNYRAGLHPGCFFKCLMCWSTE